MKIKFFILGFTLLLTSVVFAQTEKGNFVISGKSGISTGYDIHNYSSRNLGGRLDGGAGLESKSLELNATVGYFIVDNLMLGVHGLYNSELVKNYNNRTD